MHLWCFEQCFDIVELYAAGRVKPENRRFPKETSNPMSLERDSGREIVTDALKLWFNRHLAEFHAHGAASMPRPHKGWCATPAGPTRSGRRSTSTWETWACSPASPRPAGRPGARRRACSPLAIPTRRTTCGTGRCSRLSGGHRASWATTRLPTRASRATWILARARLPVRRRAKGPGLPRQMAPGPRRRSGPRKRPSSISSIRTPGPGSARRGPRPGPTLALWLPSSRGKP